MADKNKYVTCVKINCISRNNDDGILIPEKKLAKLKGWAEFTELFVSSLFIFTHNEKRSKKDD